jgi:hypothetical protein
MKQKIVQLIYLKINSDTGKVMTSCTDLGGYKPVYVANYEATQRQLRQDYESRNQDNN